MSIFAGKTLMITDIKEIRIFSRDEKKPNLLTESTRTTAKRIENFPRIHWIFKI